MKTALEQARRIFLAEREQDRMSAMQRVALQIVAGIDIDRLVQASEVEKQQAARRLTRLIERERLKGVSGHWSYDLNRHIALKQALDRLEGKAGRDVAAPIGGPRKIYSQRRRMRTTAPDSNRGQKPDLHYNCILRDADLQRAISCVPVLENHSFRHGLTNLQL